METISQLIRPEILNRTRQLAQLTRLLHACLPLNCQPHLSVAGVHDGELVLVADSPVWVNRLRMYTQSMLDMLAEHSNFEINRIRIRRAPAELRKSPPPRRKLRHLSRDSARLIRQTAGSVEDEHLQQALLRLARNTVEGD